MDRQVSTPVLDEATLRELRMVAYGDDGLLDELLAIYTEDGRRRLDALAAAVAAADASETVKVAHAFKGASRSIGAKEVGELCEHLEARGTVALPTELAALEQAFDRACQALRAGLR